MPLSKGFVPSNYFGSEAGRQLSSLLSHPTLGVGQLRAQVGFGLEVMALLEHRSAVCLSLGLAEGSSALPGR